MRERDRLRFRLGPTIPSLVDVEDEVPTISTISSSELSSEDTLRCHFISSRTIHKDIFPHKAAFGSFVQDGKSSLSVFLCFRRRGVGGISLSSSGDGLESAVDLLTSCSTRRYQRVCMKEHSIYTCLRQVYPASSMTAMSYSYS